MRSLRDSASVVGILAFYTGGTAYYLIFLRSQLIPRWLSVWGLAGTALGSVAGLLLLFRAIDVMSGAQVALNIPIGLQELVLALWLIRNGFDFAAAEDTPAGARVPLDRAMTLQGIS